MKNSIQRTIAATLTEKRFGEYHEDDVSVTIRAKSGTYGGGSEVLVICCGDQPIKLTDCNRE